jgi:lipoprotein-anchoring transpeptidase ErfK/SrfK
VVRSLVPASRLAVVAALSACSGTEPPLPRSVALSRTTAPPVAGAQLDSEPVVAAPPSPAVAVPEPDLARPEPEPEPELVATAREVVIYAAPNRRSERLGYLRLGARVARSRDSQGHDGCAGGWYRIVPAGFVCTGPAATTDPSEPLARLARTRADRQSALPYLYGRAKPLPPPIYAGLPSPEETLRLEGRAPSRATGFDDLALSPASELIAPGKLLPSPLGYARAAGTAPVRALPNAGFALLDAVEHDGRRFGLTTDLELVPLDRLTRVEASAFHGVTLDETTTLPVAFVRTRHALEYRGGPGVGLRPGRQLGHREAVLVTGERKTFDGISYLATRNGTWLRAEHALVIERPAALPPWASAKKSWLHVGIRDQTLVAYSGATPVYATLVSTGSGGLGDPEETHATPRGEFVIHTKHVAVNMDGNEVGDEFDLRDVPYVQYFTEGYALHAAYWHDAFGLPKSHGCVNLSPLDARALFHLTEPAVPQAWHGAFARTGTLVSITP